MSKKYNYFLGNTFFFHLTTEEEKMLLESVLNYSNLCNEVIVTLKNIRYFPLKEVLRCLKKAYKLYIPAYHNEVSKLEKKITTSIYITQLVHSQKFIV